MRPVRLAMLWHMHQPHYEDAASGEFALPWVRLHSAKDYVDMVDRVSEHPGLKMTFNLVPSFLEQLDGYAAGRQDAFQRLALQSAETLDAGARGFYFRHFLGLHPNMGALRWPRFAELQAQLPPNWKDLAASTLEAIFTAQDLRDLATLFHLAWLDERHWERCSVADLARRGRNFTEEEKARVLDAHLAVMARTPGAYRNARDSGQVELTCSPYYHPILPLLLDPRSAWEALPDLPLPERRWHFPEDARRHVRDALSEMERRFGARPAGMWPSEGSVSQATAALLAEEGVCWAASDEGVLACSLGLVPGPNRRVREALYQPWRVRVDGRHLDLFFRDQEISDRIGFAYQGMTVEAAVADFMGRLQHIGETWEGPNDPIVTVALDGENCWEGYEKDGDPFLRALYTALTRTPWLRTVTFSEALAETPEPPELDRLFAGSWIRNNFRIWIGHTEDNAAWERLLEAREAYEVARHSADLSSDAQDTAWRHLAAAEGSDWFWRMRPAGPCTLDDPRPGKCFSASARIAGTCESTGTARPPNWPGPDLKPPSKSGNLSGSGYGFREWSPAPRVPWKWKGGWMGAGRSRAPLGRRSPGPSPRSRCRCRNWAWCPGIRCTFR